MNQSDIKKVLLAALLLGGCGPTGQVEDGRDKTAATADSLTQCMGSVVEGVDVSDGQGRIDWARVRGAGIGFAAIKATQGTYNTQGTFAANWQGARDAGLVRGAYHFFDPTEDGAAQARHFLAVVGPLGAGDLPPLLDLECPDGNNACLGWAGGTGQAPAALIAQRVLDFLRTVEAATGKRPVIYTFPSYYSGSAIPTAGMADYPLWIANLSGTSCFGVPPPWGSARVWQYDWFGHVPGIGTNVDRDRFLGTLAELRAWAAGGGATTHLQPSGQWATGFGAPDWAGVGDFDGDGKADLAWFESWNGGSVSVALSSGGALSYAGKWLSGWGKPDRAFVGDFNGDGKADLAWYESWNGGAITVALSNGHGFTNAGKWIAGFGAPDQAFVGDFNGDGKADLAWYELWNNGSVTVVLGTQSGFAWSGKWLSGFGRPDWAGAGDFNGDGKTDLAWYEGWNNHGVTVALSSGDGFAPAGHWLEGFGAPDQAFVGDFNGDGKADLAWYEAWNDGTTSLALSTGGGFSYAGKWLTGFGKPDWAGVGDLDGDLRADLAWYEAWNNHGVTAALAR